MKCSIRQKKNKVIFIKLRLTSCSTKTKIQIDSLSSGVSPNLTKKINEIKQKLH